mmetsp:Transcript_35260/g.42537  ORF Transcript_35260/g.42537 Transcript_35260/m.42537 type:complete len:342 (+) Transcript_35260:174-1199(+)
MTKLDLTLSCSLIMTVIVCTLAKNETDFPNQNLSNEFDENEENPLGEMIQAIVECLSELIMYLIPTFLLLLALHILLYKDWATQSLVEIYLKTGKSLEGVVISCDEFKQSSDSKKQTFMIEILYEEREHRYKDHGSLRFRFPAAYDTKQFLKRFEFGRRLEVGEKIDVLLLPNNHGGGPRSGCPREVCEQILAVDRTFSHCKKCFIATGLVLIVFLVGLAFRTVSQMDVDNLSLNMSVLFGSLLFLELVCYLCAADKFLKERRSRFLSAQPMIKSNDSVESKTIRTAEEMMTGRPRRELLHRSCIGSVRPVQTRSVITTQTDETATSEVELPENEEMTSFL